MKEKIKQDELCPYQREQAEKIKALVEILMMLNQNFGTKEIEMINDIPSYSSNLKSVKLILTQWKTKWKIL